MESLQAHQLSLCILLRAYLNPADLQVVCATPTDVEKLGSLLLREIKAADTTGAPTLMQLITKLQDCLAGSEAIRAVPAMLMEQLGGLTSPDDIVNFFPELNELLNSSSLPNAEPGTGPEFHSALGMFIRKCCLTFWAMSFEAVGRLYEDLRAYQEVATQARLRSAGTSQRARPHGSVQAPAVQQYQAGQQSEGSSPMGTLKDLMPDGRQAHLARHVHALQSGDYLAALDALHQHFDTAGGGAISEPDSVGQDAVAARGQLQNALLSVGAMQAKLGHVQEALLALNEAVRVAQQNSDNGVLAESLAALCQLLAATTPQAAGRMGGPEGADVAARHHLQLLKLLRRCFQRSKEMQMPQLTGYAHLALAQFSLQHCLTDLPGKGIKRALPTAEGERSMATLGVAVAVRHMTHLHQASGLLAAVPVPPATAGNAPQNMVGATGRGTLADLFLLTPTVFGLCSVGSHASSAAAVAQLHASAHLLQGSAWQLAGSRQLAEVSALQVLANFEGTASTADQCLAYAQLAQIAASKKGYSAAEQVLQMAEAACPASNSKALQATRLALAHERALHHGDIAAAMHLAAEMCGLPDPTGATELQLRMQLEQASVRTLLAAGRQADAQEAAAGLFNECRQAGLQIEAAQMLLLLGRSHLEAGSPLTGLPHILSCLLHCRDFHLDALRCEATVALAETWLALGGCHAARAAAELQGVLPQVLGQASMAAQGAAQLLLGKCLLAGAHVAQLRADPGRYTGPLQGAAHAFEAVENWSKAAEAQHLLAMTANSLQNASLRNTAAAAFRRLQRQAQLHTAI